MDTITVTLEADVDGTLHVPVPQALRHAKFKVIATLVEETPEAAEARERDRQKRLSEALDELARSNPFRGIDPMAWQREMREDRELPTPIGDGSGK